MLKIKRVKTPDGEIVDHAVESQEEGELDAEERLTLLPALIDTHVHFRTPGQEYKEDWVTGAKAAVAGGITRVFDMPNNLPPCVSKEALEKKKALIDSQLQEAGIPLRYNLYFGAGKESIETLGQVRGEVVGLKIFMGSSTGGLVMDDPETLERAFQLAAQHDLIVSVHAEDEETIRRNSEKYRNESAPSVHSRVRSREAAVKATEQAISLLEKYGGQLCILHTSTKEELELIRAAKKEELLVYCETTPHHLFLDESLYEKWGCKVQVNPPLRTEGDREALWAAVHDGTVDFIGTDHAPHTLEEKERPYGEAPSGVPGIELLLPLLLNACSEGKITLDKIVQLTRINAEQIFRLPRNGDLVLVDMEKERRAEDALLKSKCGWSPYAGMTLKGWPAYTILKGKVYPCDL